MYEFRTYCLKPGNLPLKLAGWQEAIEPPREYTDWLVINMYVLDGLPRTTHIWGFTDFGQRSPCAGRLTPATSGHPGANPDQSWKPR